MIKRILLLTLLLVQVTAAGCSSGMEKEVKKAVDDYNRTLITVLHSGSTDLLASVATQREVGRMNLSLSNLNDEKKTIDADIHSIKFSSVQVRQGKNEDAKVQTQEIWNYKYLDSRNNDIIEGPYRIRYDVTYSLIKRENKWVVDEVYFQEKKF